MLRHGRTRDVRWAMESLESRQLLSGDGITPPPMIDDVGLVSFDSQHRLVRANDFHAEVQLVEDVFASEVGNEPTNPDPLLAGDFNGDGVTDFLSVDSAHDWYLHLNDGTQLFQKAVGEGLSEHRPLDTADFDADGALDVISIHPTSGELIVSLNRGDRFEHQRWGEFSNPRGWTQLFVNDFTGDGRPDLLGGDVGGHWWLAMNHEGRGFLNHRWGRYGDYSWQDVVEGEFTGDAFQDVVARASDNTWWLWQGTETGFQLSRYFSHWKMREDWHDVGVADFNGDGMDDVIGRSDDGRLWVGTATADGFHTWTWGDGWVHQANWSQVSIVDMNGDGLPDQVGHADGDTWWYALNTGVDFQNHFWRRQAEVDFVLPGFRRTNAVDLGPWLPQSDPTPHETKDLRVTLDDQNRLVLWPDDATSISAIFLQEPNGTLVAAEGGLVDSFSRFNTGCYVHREDTTLLTGPIVLGVAWAPERGNLDAQVTVHRHRGAHEPFVGADYIGSVQADSEVAPNGRLIPNNNCHADDPVHDLGTVSVVDGRLTLFGAYPSLAGIEVSSKGGFLALDRVAITEEVGYDLRLPFKSDAAVIRKSAHLIAYGVLGADKQIDLDGETQTSVLYSGSLEDIANGDLFVRVGVNGLSVPTRVEIVPQV